MERSKSTAGKVCSGALGYNALISCSKSAKGSKNSLRLTAKYGSVGAAKVRDGSRLCENSEISLSSENFPHIAHNGSPATLPCWDDMLVLGK